MPVLSLTLTGAPPGRGAAAPGLQTPSAPFRAGGRFLEGALTRVRIPALSPRPGGLGQVPPLSPASAASPRKRGQHPAVGGGSACESCLLCQSFPTVGGTVESAFGLGGTCSKEQVCPEFSRKQSGYSGAAAQVRAEVLPWELPAGPRARSPASVPSPWEAWGSMRVPGDACSPGTPAGGRPDML